MPGAAAAGFFAEAEWTSKCLSVLHLYLKIVQPKEDCTELGEGPPFRPLNILSWPYVSKGSLLILDISSVAFHRAHIWTVA